MKILKTHHRYPHQQLVRPRKKAFVPVLQADPPLDVKLVHNAMESFQQKVPPISLGDFEDIFD
jgi:hypothetical protein